VSIWTLPRQFMNKKGGGLARLTTEEVVAEFGVAFEASRSIKRSGISFIQRHGWARNAYEVHEDGSHRLIPKLRIGRVVHILGQSLFLSKGRECPDDCPSPWIWPEHVAGPG